MMESGTGGLKDVEGKYFGSLDTAGSIDVPVVPVLDSSTSLRIVAGLSLPRNVHLAACVRLPTLEPGNLLSLAGSFPPSTTK